MSIKVTSSVSSQDNPIKADIKVHSHWSDNDKVIIDFPNDFKITVNAYDMMSAIQNAINTNIKV